MIKIERRTIEVDKDFFIKELKELALLFKGTSRIGFDLKIINKEFKCKLTEGDFLKICKQFEIPLYRGKVILFTELDKFFS